MQIVILKKVSNCTLTFLSTAGQTEISSGIFNILNKNSSLENFLFFLSIFFFSFSKKKKFLRFKWINLIISRKDHGKFILAGDIVIAVIPKDCKPAI